MAHLSLLLYEKLDSGFKGMIAYNSDEGHDFTAPFVTHKMVLTTNLNEVLPNTDNATVDYTLDTLYSAYTSALNSTPPCSRAHFPHLSGTKAQGRLMKYDVVILTRKQSKYEITSHSTSNGNLSNSSYILVIHLRTASQYQSKRTSGDGPKPRKSRSPGDVTW